MVAEFVRTPRNMSVGSLFGAALELLVALAVLAVWIGSIPASVRYSEIYNLHLIALMPPVGWLWRGAIGCFAMPGMWLTRLYLISIAAFLWAQANGHSVFCFNECLSDGPPPYGFALKIGMHLALGASVAFSIVSAYWIWSGGPRGTADAS